MVSELVLRVLSTVHLSFAKDEDGQTLAEYGLIISLVAVAAAVTAIIVFRGALAGAFNSAVDCMNKVTC